MLEEVKPRKAKVWSDNAKPWLEKSHGWDGIRLRNRLGKSTNETGKKPTRGAKREEWKVRQIFQATKLFREDVSLILMKR